MTKKILASLLVGLTACAAIPVQARNTQADRADITRQVAAKISDAQFEHSLKVTLHITYKTKEDGYSDFDKTYESVCSAVIINPAGDLAIRKDCLTSLFFGAVSSHFDLWADMENLGHSSNGFHFMCDLTKVNRNLFADKETYWLFSLRKYLHPQAKQKLGTLFKAKGLTGLPQTRIENILRNMPKKTTQLVSW